MSDAIYITGAGIVSALGTGKEETWKNIHSRRSGIGAVHHLSTLHTEFPVGEVQWSNDEMARLLGWPMGRPVSRTSLMGMIAAKEAIMQAQLHKQHALRIAFLSGTTVGGMDLTEQYYNDYLTNDSRNVYIHTHDCGTTTEMIADYFGIFSFISSISTACSSAANALLFGAEMIRTHRADIVVAGGSECLTKLHLNGFRSLMILTTEPCSPFDAHTHGLNLGEGAAYLVMESEDSIRRRGVTPLALFSGGANTCDAYHQTATSPDGRGPYEAMYGAIQQAGLTPPDIDYINLHGTGTLNNDQTEGVAIKRLFGDKVPPASSTKSYTGHTTSASGGIEAVISLLAMEHNAIPVSLHFQEPMEPHHIVPTLEETPPRALRHVLSNSFGFGGNDTSLIFSKL